MLAHNVYFTLNDPTPENKQRLLDSIQTHLTEHSGVVYFGAGTLVEDLDRPVNDRDFHVGLHLIFADRDAHDVYQVSERHQAFIAENKETWKQVRVFDSLAES